MTNAYFTSIDQYRDLDTLNHWAEARQLGAPAEQLLHSYRVKSRDNARTPMLWDDSDQAGFTTGEPWLPVNRNKDEINVETALADPDSVWHHYCALIALRKGEAPLNRVVREGVFELLAPDHEQLFCYTRTVAGVGQVLVLANMSSAPCELPSGLPAQGELVLGTHDADDPRVLAPWESRISWLV